MPSKNELIKISPANLVSIRVTLEISISAMARAFGVSYAGYYGWEVGRSKPLREALLKGLRDLVARLEVDEPDRVFDRLLAFVLGGDDPPFPPGGAPRWKDGMSPALPMGAPPRIDTAGRAFASVVGKIERVASEWRSGLREAGAALALIEDLIHLEKNCGLETTVDYVGAYARLVA